MLLKLSNSSKNLMTKYLWNNWQVGNEFWCIKTIMISDIMNVQHYHDENYHFRKGGTDINIRYVILKSLDFWMLTLALSVFFLNIFILCVSPTNGETFHSRGNLTFKLYLKEFKKGFCVYLGIKSLLKNIDYTFGI